MRRRHLAALLLVPLVLACEGPVGPAGPAGAAGPTGPAGPMGPAGKSVAYQVFEGAITSTTMNTDAVNTGGVVPGIVCYISHSSSPNT